MKLGGYIKFRYFFHNPFYKSLILGVSFAIFIALGFLSLWNWGSQEIRLPQAKIVTLSRGMPLSELSTSLYEAQVITSPLAFRAYVKFFCHYNEAQAGDYLFEGPTSPEQIFKRMVAGEIYNPLVLTLTIPEGYSIKDISEKIAKELDLPPEEVLAFTTNEKFLTFLDLPGPSLEGFLYPATYNFYGQKPDLEKVFHEMVDEFFKRIPEDYEKSVQELGLTLYEAMTFASLVEKEAFLETEKPLIAEVIWRRLKKNVPLGIDASVIYGIKSYQGDIKASDLRDKSNPYNTRVHVGLPPTPICSPTVGALAAVLKPSQFGYFYFVLNAQVPKSHHFTKTLKEHNKYVQELVRHQKRAK